MPCSRIEAPFAQCAPRLIGESNTGSWRIHTPFCTCASTAQPTEQCVQTVRFTSIFAVSAAAALASSTMLNGSWLASAPALIVMPERFRNVRRSIVRPRRPATGRVRRSCAREPAPASFALRVSSIAASSDLGGAVVVADVLGELIALLGLHALVLRGVLRARLCDDGRDAGRTACTCCEQEIPA